MTDELTLPERMRERADAYYGSQHELLRATLIKGAERIEELEGVLRQGREMPSELDEAILRAVRGGAD